MTYQRALFSIKLLAFFGVDFFSRLIARWQQILLQRGLPWVDLDLRLAKFIDGANDVVKSMVLLRLRAFLAQPLANFRLTTEETFRPTFCNLAQGAFVHGLPRLQCLLQRLLELGTIDKSLQAGMQRPGPLAGLNPLVSLGFPVQLRLEFVVDGRDEVVITEA